MYALYIHSISKWPLPSLAIYSKYKSTKYSIAITFYHTITKNFFGKTWKSCSFDYTDEEGEITLNEAVIFHSKIRDSNCVAVVELVAAAEKQSETNVLSSQVSCGWTMIQPFVTELRDVHSNDYEEEEDNDEEDVIPWSFSKLYRGTPRKMQFLSQVDYNQIIDGLSSYQGCEICYNVVISSKMASDISYFVQENSIVSAYDKVLGLEFKHCQEHKRHIEDREGLWKNLQSMQLSNDKFHIEMRRIVVIIPNRSLFENKLCDALNSTIPKEEAFEKKSKLFGMSSKLVKQDISSKHGQEKNIKAKIINRSLKIGLYDKNTQMPKSWKVIELETSDENENDVLCMKCADLIVDGMVRRGSCALLFVLEFTIKPSQTVIRNHTAEARKGSSSTADLFPVIIGCQFFSPTDAKENKQLRSIQLTLISSENVRNLSHARLYSCRDIAQNIQVKFDIMDEKITNNLKMESRRIGMRSMQTKRDINITPLHSEEMPKGKNDIKSIQPFIVDRDEEFSSDRFDENENNLLLLESQHCENSSLLARPLEEVYNEELEEDFKHIRGAKQSQQHSINVVTTHNKKYNHESNRLQNIAAVSCHCSNIGEKTPAQKRCETLGQILNTKEEIHVDKLALELELLKWFREGQKRDLIQDHIRKHKEAKDFSIK